ncbi:MAG: isocitrate lyase/phosphoenolpyruvate mutase family protein [Granulosicoccus sp.]
MCIDSDNKVSAAETFKKLHEERSTFVMPCAWDAFSALVLERAGFSCIGTTSGGVNWVNGRKDDVYTNLKEEMLAAYGDIVSATRLPVSGDLEMATAKSSEEVDSTVPGSPDAVMVGGSIEDQGIWAIPYRNRTSIKYWINTVSCDRKYRLISTRRPMLSIIHEYERQHNVLSE